MAESAFVQLIGLVQLILKARRIKISITVHVTKQTTLAIYGTKEILMVILGQQPALLLIPSFHIMKEQGIGRRWHGSFMKMFRAIPVWSFIQNTLHSTSLGMNRQKMEISSYVEPKGYLTRPGMKNFSVPHAAEYQEFINAIER